jgi:hypothetical protein
MLKAVHDHYQQLRVSFAQGGSSYPQQFTRMLDCGPLWQKVRTTADQVVRNEAHHMHLDYTTQEQIADDPQQGQHPRGRCSNRRRLPLCDARLPLLSRLRQRVFDTFELALQEEQ